MRPPSAPIPAPMPTSTANPTITPKIVAPINRACTWPVLIVLSAGACRPGATNVMIVTRPTMPPVSAPTTPVTSPAIEPEPTLPVRLAARMPATNVSASMARNKTHCNNEDGPVLLRFTVVKPLVVRVETLYAPASHWTSVLPSPNTPRIAPKIKPFRIAGWPVCCGGMLSPYLLLCMNEVVSWGFRQAHCLPSSIDPSRKHRNVTTP